MTVCEFISEPWEWLHEASSRVSDRIYICNRKKKPRRSNKLVSKSGFKPGAPGVSPPPPPTRLIIVFSILRQIFEETKL